MTPVGPIGPALLALRLTDFQAFLSCLQAVYAREKSLPGTAKALQISETTLKRYFRKHPKLKAAATAGRSVDRLGRVKWDGKAEGE